MWLPGSIVLFVVAVQVVIVVILALRLRARRALPPIQRIGYHPLFGHVQQLAGDKLLGE
jgi:hypothetical protein